MNPPDATARKAAWSSYWAAGDLHSCAGSYPGNYSGAIGAFWQAVFDRLGPGQRVLDLATGNGALPLLLWERRQQHGMPEVDAVDLAQVAPAWHSADTHSGIRVHSGVAMERLPFADASFDLVTSQFGFEYAEREPALRECLRVIRPGGAIALVMHHADSVLAEVARTELANQALLLADGGLLDATATVLPWFARARAGADLRAEAAASRDREAYNAASRALGSRIAASRAPDLLLEARDRIQRLLAGVGPDPSPSLRALADYRAALVAAGLRSEEMISHALDHAQVAAMVSALRAAWPSAEVHCEPLRQREGVLGWALQAGPAVA